MSGTQQPVPAEQQFVPTAADVLVANQALARMGQPSIQAFTDPTPQARIINRLYPVVRDNLLALRRWSFATARQALTLSGNGAPFPWQAEYLRPAGCILPRYFVNTTTGETAYIGDERAPFEAGQALVVGVWTPVLWTNINPAMLVFTAQVVTPGAWEPGFNACMTMQLAAEACLGITGDARLASALAEQAGRAIASTDAGKQSEGVSQQQRGSQAYAARGY